jgi:hypothetical protein
VITRQLEAAEVLSKLSTMNGKSFRAKDPLVITKQVKLYFNNYSRIPTQDDLNPDHTKIVGILNTEFCIRITTAKKRIETRNNL